MAQRESMLSRKIMAALKAEGWFCFKIHGGPTMLAGLPDILCCAEGAFIGLETKNPESRRDVSDRQYFVHDQIREVGGGYVAVVCTPDEAVAAVRAGIAELKAKLSPK